MSPSTPLPAAPRRPARCLRLLSSSSPALVVFACPDPGRQPSAGLPLRAGRPTRRRLAARIRAGQTREGWRFTSEAVDGVREPARLPTVTALIVNSVDKSRRLSTDRGAVLFPAGGSARKGSMKGTHWTAQELMQLGITEGELRRRLKSGAIRCLRRGHYAFVVDESPEERHLRLIGATTLDVAATSVFSHTSAAVLHGLPVPVSALEAVTMTRMSSGHGDGGPQLRVRNTRLNADQITSVGGFLTTTIERTVCDVARLSSFEWGVAAADAALRRGVDLTMLDRTLRWHPRLHGLKRARHVIAFADGLSESVAESLSRAQMAKWGIPRPTLQYEIFDDNGELVGRADFAWPELGLVGEVDGKAKYGHLLKPGQTPDDVVMEEKRREQRIRRCGLWVVRWGWDEAMNGAQLASLLNDGFRNALPRSA